VRGPFPHLVRVFLTPSFRQNRAKQCSHFKALFWKEPGSRRGQFLTFSQVPRPNSPSADISPDVILGRWMIVFGKHYGRLGVQSYSQNERKEGSPVGEGTINMCVAIIAVTPRHGTPCGGRARSRYCNSWPDTQRVRETASARLVKTGPSGVAKMSEKKCSVLGCYGTHLAT
jgi:hypothetical protein